MLFLKLNILSQWIHQWCIRFLRKPVVVSKNNTTMLLGGGTRRKPIKTIINTCPILTNLAWYIYKWHTCVVFAVKGILPPIHVSFSTLLFSTWHALGFFVVIFCLLSLPARIFLFDMLSPLKHLTAPWLSQNSSWPNVTKANLVDNVQPKMVSHSSGGTNQPQKYTCLSSRVCAPNIEQILPGLCTFYSV